MKSNFSLFDTAGLEKALDFCTMRNTVISSNIANANSPNYQAHEIVFEEELGRAEGRASQGFQLKRTPVISSTGKPVDIISEMTSLAKNQVFYSAYTTRLNGIFKNLKWIIDNSGR